jgi:hypothetical protein
MHLFQSEIFSPFIATKYLTKILPAISDKKYATAFIG